MELKLNTKFLKPLMLLFLLVSFPVIHSQNRTEELTYLQTDKGIYETGEDLWFKSYVFDRSTLSLSGADRTLFVDEVTGQKYFYIQHKILILHYDIFRI